MYKFIVVIVLLLSAQAMAIDCDEKNTPEIVLNDSLDVFEGQLFTLDVDSAILEENTFYKAMPLTSFPSFKITEKGEISVNASRNDLGKHNVLISGYTEDLCIDSKIITFNVYGKPDFTFTPKEKSLKTQEGRGITFLAKEKNSGDRLNFLWSVDEESISKNNEFVYLPEHNSAGSHVIKLIVTDSRGLRSEVEWDVRVTNVNRPPALFTDIPNIYMFTELRSQVLDLKQYLYDPDADKISFSFKEAELKYETIYRPTDIKVELEDNIVSMISPRKPGYKLYKFIATDEHGLSTESNIVKFETLPTFQTLASSYCGDGFCSPAETCTKCEEDCGVCNSACIPEWQCSLWEPCSSSDVRVRECKDLNDCKTSQGKPLEIEKCVFSETCKDNIKNQDETKVDCGGVCGPCPTCFDEIKNQGEEGVDCGGPCKVCESCEDNIKNQDESDIDCGGSCNKCEAGKKCRTKLDCYSFACENTVCLKATCFDKVRNQGETKIDCGGPCGDCPTCFDGIRNQKEEGIDCGGPCNICPTCEDGIKNQEERIVDCGGPCARCTIVDYFNYLEFKQIFVILIVLVFVLISLPKYILEIMSRITRKISFLESDEHLGEVVLMNKIFRLIKKRRGNGLAAQARNKLTMSLTVHNITHVLEEFFYESLGTDKKSSYDDNYKAIKRAYDSFIVRTLMIILLQKLWLLKTESAHSSESLNRVRKDGLRILNELKKDI